MDAHVTGGLLDGSHDDHRRRPATRAPVRQLRDSAAVVSVAADDEPATVLRVLRSPGVVVTELDEQISGTDWRKSAGSRSAWPTHRGRARARARNVNKANRRRRAARRSRTSQQEGTTHV